MEYQYKQDSDTLAFWGGVFVTLLAITFVFLTLHWWGHRGEHHHPHNDKSIYTYEKGFRDGKRDACYQFQQALDSHDIKRTLPCMRIYWSYP